MCAASRTTPERLWIFFVHEQLSGGIIECVIINYEDDKDNDRGVEEYNEEVNLQSASPLRSSKRFTSSLGLHQPHHKHQ